MKIRHLSLLLLIFIISATSVQSQDKENYYKKFYDAYYKGNHADALQYIESAYRENPDNQLYAYWYSNELIESKNFIAALPLLQKIPPAFNDGWAAANLGKVYELLGKTAEARAMYESAIKNKAIGEDARETMQLRLIKILYGQKDFPALLKNHEMVITSAKKGSIGRNLLLDLVLLYIMEASSSYADGKKAQGDSFSDKAAALQAGFSPDTDLALGPEWSNAFTYYKNNYKSGAQYTEYRMLVMYFTNTTIDNGTSTVPRTLSKTDIKQYDEVYEAYRRMLYYLSSGKVLLTINKIVIDSHVEFISAGKDTSDSPRNFYAPVTDAELGKVTFENRNKYDAFAYVFPLKDLKGTYYHSFKRLEFVPKRLSSDVKRSHIYMPDFTSDTSIIRMAYSLTHEIFHSCEDAYSGNYPFKLHIWGKDNKSDWPEWYNGTNGEFGYYKSAFDAIILPAGTELIRHGDTMDSRTEDDFIKALDMN